eukprot:4988610-Alexandrium_andersonii.AAC.1
MLPLYPPVQAALLVCVVGHARDLDDVRRHSVALEFDRRAQPMQSAIPLAPSAIKFNSSISRSSAIRFTVRYRTGMSTFEPQTAARARALASMPARSARSRA